MYRVLAANAEVRERRHQLRDPAHHKPELLATGPNQVWSRDITRLLGPVNKDAEVFCQRFFPWDNTERPHGALGLMTPHAIHYGLAAAK